MLIHKQNDRFDIFILRNESICFRKLVAYLHKSVNTPMSVFITFSGRNLKGLDVVENIEVLFDHTPVIQLTIVMERSNPNYVQLNRITRFIKDIYGYNINIVSGVAIEMSDNT